MMKFSVIYEWIAIDVFSAEYLKSRYILTINQNNFFFAF